MINKTDQLEHKQEEIEADEKTNFGFWVYIMTDCILFASLFATYAVLRRGTFGGPGPAELFHRPNALAETLILLTSSFTCGLGLISISRRRKKQVLQWFSLTFVLGLAFLILELSEFNDLISQGYKWSTNGFLSAFFTLVGTHGLHITIGLIWILIMLWRTHKKGLSRSNIRRLTMLGLFWHFLDIIWIFIFTIVYLMGAIKL